MGIADTEAVHLARAFDQLDQVALALPAALSSARSKTLSNRAQAVVDLCQLLRLLFLLKHPVQEAADISDQILAETRQMLVLAYSSRASQRARMTIALAKRCAEDVQGHLRELTGHRATAADFRWNLLA